MASKVVDEESREKTSAVPNSSLHFFLSFSLSAFLPIQRLLRHGVVHARQVREIGQRREGVEVGQILQRVVSQNQRREFGGELLQVGADPRDPVVGEQQCSQSRETREAVEGEDAVVGEVDRVELVLFLSFELFPFCGRGGREEER